MEIQCKIHHCKGLEKEITDDDYLHDQTPSGKAIPSQTSNMVYYGFAIYHAFGFCIFSDIDIFISN